MARRRLKEEMQLDLQFALLMKYKKPVIDMQVILEEYMPHLSYMTACRRAAKHSLPFPVFKLDGERSGYFVHLSDIAQWLESTHRQAREDWQEIQDIRQCNF